MSKRSQRDAAQSQLVHSGHSGAGPSLVSTLESWLLDSCVKYLELKRVYMEESYGPVPDDLDAARSVKRGEIRGLARAVAKMRLPYEDQSVIVKRVEKEFIRKAKQ